jgi:hypothetical protein
MGLVSIMVEPGVETWPDIITEPFAELSSRLDCGRADMPLIHGAGRRSGFPAQPALIQPPALVLLRCKRDQA